MLIPKALEAVHAGFPSVAQDYFDGDFSFDENVIIHPDTTFIVTVAGDSMQGAGIFDGALLIVDRSLPAQENDVVIARRGIPCSTRRTPPTPTSIFIGRRMRSSGAWSSGISIGKGLKRKDR